MRMYNQALLARNSSATPAYSIERIERTGSSNYPSWVYPANDWYDIMFKDYSVNHRLGVNVRGGSRVIQYYASVNYVRDQGMLKTDRLNQFDVNIIGLICVLEIDWMEKRQILTHSFMWDIWNGGVIL